MGRNQIKPTAEVRVASAVRWLEGEQAGEGGQPTRRGRGERRKGAGGTGHFVLAGWPISGWSGSSENDVSAWAVWGSGGVGSIHTLRSTFFDKRFILITKNYKPIPIITHIYITLVPTNTNSSLPKPSRQWLYPANCGTRVGALSASPGSWLAVPRTGVITFSRNITLLYGIHRIMYCQEITGVRKSGRPGALVMCNPHLGLGGEEHEEKC